MRKKQLLGSIQFIIDLFIIFYSYYGLTLLKSKFGKPYSIQNIIAVRQIMPYILIIFILLFFAYKLYEIDELDIYEIFLGIIFSVIILAFFTLALSFFARAFAVPRTLIVYSLLFQTIFLSLAHYIIYKLYARISKPIYALIITFSNIRAEKIINFFNGLKGRLNLDKVIINDDGVGKILAAKIEEYRAFILDNSLPPGTKSKIAKLLIRKGKQTYIIPDIYDLLLLNPSVHIFGDKMLLEVKLNNITLIDRIVKRVLDIAVSLTALIVFSPIVLGVSIAILIDSGRPIFYLQERAGLYGKMFKIIKFRTMVQDAEKYTGAVLSSENDPRVTKVGKFLRKTGFDEIPQFINILKGEMSVVGPRPERPELIEKIKKEIPDFEMRLKVKPGLTGLAQLAGKYDTPFDEKLKMDLAYSKQKFLFFVDLYIILNTAKLFFLPKKRK